MTRWLFNGIIGFFVVLVAPAVLLAAGVARLAFGDDDSDPDDVASDAWDGDTDPGLDDDPGEDVDLHATDVDLHATDADLRSMDDWDSLRTREYGNES